MTLDTYSWYAVGIHYPVIESIRTTLSKKGKKKMKKMKVWKIPPCLEQHFTPIEKQTLQVETAPIPEDKTEAELGAVSVFKELFNWYWITTDA